MLLIEIYMTKIKLLYPIFYIDFLSICLYKSFFSFANLVKATSKLFFTWF